MASPDKGWESGLGWNRVVGCCGLSMLEFPPRADLESTQRFAPSAARRPFSPERQTVPAGGVPTD